MEEPPPRLCGPGRGGAGGRGKKGRVGRVEESTVDEGLGTDGGEDVTLC